MRKRNIVATVMGALLLAGCSGGGDEPPAMGPTDPGTVVETSPTSTPADTGGGQAAGDFDCDALTPEQAVQFIVWTQMFAQVRTVDGLQTMAALQYTPEAMAATLDLLDGLKGVKGEVYGTPDDALVVMRSANDAYAAIIKKGDAATDADFAVIAALEPDTASWITAQATITTALNTACPDLDLSS